jgi:hypothetical protein
LKIGSIYQWKSYEPASALPLEEGLCSGGRPPASTAAPIREMPEVERDYYMWVLHVGGGEREGTVITNIDKVGVFRYFSVHIHAGKGDMACHVCKNDKCVASRID